MLRILVSTLVLSVVMTFPEAQAMSGARAQQPAAASCKKVKVSFACRTRGSGTVSLPCAAGESEAACCARWKSRHTDPQSGLCRGHGGVVSYKCTCPKAALEGGSLDRPAGIRMPQPRLLPAPGPKEPGEPDTPTAPGAPGGPPAPPSPLPPPQPPVPGEPPGMPELPGATGPGDPEPPRIDRFGDKHRRYCERVSLNYACKSGFKGQASYACGKGQGQGDCCRMAIARICGGEDRLDSERTGRIQSACKCVKWSPWTKRR